MAKKQMKKKKPSPELAAIIGSAPVNQMEATKKFWDYVKKKKLQDPDNRRNILTGDDDKLYALTGRDSITMFQVGSYLAENLS